MNADVLNEIKKYLDPESLLHFRKINRLTKSLPVTELENVYQTTGNDIFKVCKTGNLPLLRWFGKGFGTVEKMLMKCAHIRIACRYNHLNLIKFMLEEYYPCVDFRKLVDHLVIYTVILYDRADILQYFIDKGLTTNMIHIRDVAVIGGTEVTTFCLEWHKDFQHDIVICIKDAIISKNYKSLQAMLHYTKRKGIDPCVLSGHYFNYNLWDKLEYIITSFNVDPVHIHEHIWSNLRMNVLIQADNVEKRISLVNLLLDLGCPVNLDAFYYICIINNMELVRRVLSTNCFSEHTIYTGILCACANNNMELIELLMPMIKFGTDIFTQRPTYEQFNTFRVIESGCMLSVLATYDHLDTMKWVVHKYGITELTCHSEPLYYAAINNRIQVVRYLVEDLGFTFPNLLNYIVDELCRRGHCRMIDLLNKYQHTMAERMHFQSVLEHGIETACIAQKIKVLRSLFKKYQIDPRLNDNQLLHIAIPYDFDKITYYLREVGNYTDQEFNDIYYKYNTRQD